MRLPVVLLLLVAGHWMDPVDSFACTTDAACQYKGCNDVVGTARCYWWLNPWDTYCVYSSSTPCPDPPCEAGWYMAGTGSCAACPEHTSSVAESDEVTDCVCVAGYTASSDGEACSACETGRYKAVTGAGECSMCPAGTSSASGSDALADCMCLAGYSGTSDGAACTACEAGTYKAATGTGECSTCPAGTSSASGSDALDVCKCLAGYSGSSDGAVCSACEAGRYKVTDGTGSCTACPSHTSSAERSVALDDCKCSAGYTAASDGAACSACEAGTYKTATGSGSCTACPSHTSSAEGSDEVTDCVCLAGYTVASDGLQCSACDAGKYKAVTGAGACSTCPVGTSSTSGSVELTDCKCVAGYSGTSDGAACTACEAGGYKIAMGAGECSTCPTGTSSALGSDALEDCKCLAGYSGASDGVVCSACEAGGYKATVGMGNCTACPSHTSSVEGSDELTDCVCVAGYTAASDGLQCSACVAGTFKSVTGSGSCAACPLHTSSAKGSYNATDCVCVAGYTVVSDGAACTACGVGTYKVTTGAGECSTCPAGTGSASGSNELIDCTCLAGYSGTSDGAACTACDAGKYKPALGAGVCRRCPMGTSSASRSTTRGDCKCLAGYSGTSDGVVCSACAAGGYKPTAGTGNCTACPSHTSSPPGSWNVTDCTCVPGYAAAAPGEACAACAAGAYKFSSGVGKCVTCPVGTVSASGSVEVIDCTCLAGFSGTSDGAACTACEAGTFKPAGGAGQCSTCPANSESSFRSALCYCSAGFVGPDGGPCDVCSYCTSAVTFTATLAMALAEFNASGRATYVNGVAEAVSVAPSSVAITSIAEQLSRRRLLAASVAVETTVTVSKDKAASVAAAATSEHFNTFLASSHISVAEVSPCSVADAPPPGDPTTPPAPEGGSSAGVVVGTLAGGLALLGGVGGWWWRRRGNWARASGECDELGMLEVAERVDGDAKGGGWTGRVRTLLCTMRGNTLGMMRSPAPRPEPSSFSL